MSTAPQYTANLLAELEAAQRIIRNALAIMSTTQKAEWGRLNARDGVDGEGITRANEREAVITQAKNGGVAKRSQTDDLRDAVEDISHLGYDSMREIAAVARLCLNHLKNEDTAHDIETVVVVLNSIWAKARDIESCIYTEALDVGIQLMDQRATHHLKNQFKATNGGAA